jgi:hypothetical protein
MARVRTEINEDYATVAEDLVINTYVGGSLVAGNAVLQVSQGAAATTVTIQRCPITDNNGQTAPLDNDPNWVNIQAPGAVDASNGGSLIQIANNAACWIKYKADKVCKSYLSFRKP